MELNIALYTFNTKIDKLLNYNTKSVLSLTGSLA